MGCNWIVLAQSKSTERGLLNCSGSGTIKLQNRRENAAIRDDTPAVAHLATGRWYMPSPKLSNLPPGIRFKGRGRLVRWRRPRHPSRALTDSGLGHDREGIRNGTVPTPLAVGTGAACKLAVKAMECDNKRIFLTSKWDSDEVGGDRKTYDQWESVDNRYPRNLKFSFAYFDGENLPLGLKS